jgi:hypothetical protein
VSFFDFLLGLFAMPVEETFIQTRRYRHCAMPTYEVLVDDFDRIEEEAQTIGSDLTFATFWISEALTSTLALPSIPSAWIHIFSAFLMALIVGYGFGAYFLWRWSKQKNALKKLMKKIRDSQIPEWGQDDKELRFSELASMKPVQAPPQTNTEGDA